MNHRHAHARSGSFLRLAPLLLFGGAVYLYVRLRERHFPLDPAKAEAKRANQELQANMRRALEMKREADARKPHHPESQTAHEGMRNNPNRDIAPSGALEAEGFRPAFGRGGMARGVE